MSYCKLEIQKIKVEDENDDDANNKNHEPAVICHNLWNQTPEDLLMEIFIRHPDCRSAVRTTTVCRQWHSLILRNSQFIRRYKSHHRHKIFPWTIMFRSTNSYKPFQTLGQLYSDEWMCLHGKLPANFLDFLPSPMLIKASCNDLLLVSPGLSCIDDLYICNPVTKQFVQLPAVPKLDDSIINEVWGKGYALAAMPPSGANTNTQFKVVVIYPLYDHRDFRTQKVSIFCSESKKWEIRDFPAPLLRTWWSSHSFSNDINIRCKEILFWVRLESERIFYLDLSKEKCGVINIPSGDLLFENRFGILHVSSGLDELRLIQVLRMDTAEIVPLRVWRLNNNRHNNDHEDDDSNWILVHDKKLRRPKNLSEKQPLTGTFVHPTDVDLVFVIWDKTVIEYNLIIETYKKITAELLEIDYWQKLTPFLIDLSSGSSNLANTYF